MSQVFKIRSVLLSATAAVVLSGCAATVDQGRSRADLSVAVGDRAGGDVSWQTAGGQDPAVAARIAQLSAAPLTVDGAVQLTLLAHPALQARYAELGIAQADLVEAGLVSNPVLDVSVRATDALAVLEFGLIQNLLDVFTRAQRVKAADAAYRAATLSAAQAAVAAAAETRRAYFELQGAKNVAAVMAEVRDAAETSWQLAERFHAAGNISDLELAEERAAFEDAVVELAEAELEVAAAEREFALAVGVVAPALQVSGTLPAAPETEPAATGLEQTALDRRLDLAAARREVEAATAELKLAADWRLWQELEAGAVVEREDDGEWIAGPEFALALPLFNQGQPAVARAAMAVLKAENEAKAVEAEIRAEVREAAARVAALRGLVDRYRATILPLKSEIVGLKQREYNFMLIGAFELLVAKREEIETFRAYVAALRDYWLARADLVAATGGGTLAVPATTDATP
ncbi:MAG: TolC family protein [Rhodospirillaceae bacterium]|nr:TolC family protein [Rhodospirillaceae bacterium]